MSALTSRGGAHLRLLVILLSLLTLWAVLVPTHANARRIEEYDPGAHTTEAAHPPKKPAKPPAKTPSKPPAKSTATTEAETTSKPSGAEEASSSSPLSGDEPFSGNGGGSPLCNKPTLLSAAAQKNCETSDFVAAPDPTGNYAFDVNINTSVSNWSNDVATTIENFLQFGWIALVALVHGLLVIFEWCYSQNQLTESIMPKVARGLHETQLAFTKPWMVVVLSVAALLALYYGLVKRRVAETIGQVLMMLAMMAGGLWVIANPQGTVGALANWANSASLGTLGAATSGNPENGTRTLANGMQNVFSAVVSGPWCYMEFGDEHWCRQPENFDKKLQSAALKIAKSQEEKSKGGTDAQDKALEVSSTLLRRARTNGELFLALPANGPERNSVKTEGMLLNVLCGKGSSADDCEGDTAAQAEFRTEKGTGSRVIGLVLIWIGGLGMLLLFGLLAFRLLEAAIASIFYLLLAPVAVLAPALGDGGRSAFRGWGMRLLAAVISKLIYSFLLGVVIFMMDLLLALPGLGWWAQWLLVTALWWVALHHRHKVLDFAHNGTGGHDSRSMRWYYRMGMVHDIGRFAGWAREKLAAPPTATNRTRQLPPPERARTSSKAPGGGATGSSIGSGPIRPNEDPTDPLPSTRKSSQVQPGQALADEQPTSPETPPDPDLEQRQVLEDEPVNQVAPTREQSEEERDLEPLSGFPAPPPIHDQDEKADAGAPDRVEPPTPTPAPSAAETHADGPRPEPPATTSSSESASDQGEAKTPQKLTTTTVVSSAQTKAPRVSAPPSDKASIVAGTAASAAAGTQKKESQSGEKRGGRAVESEPSKSGPSKTSPKPSPRSTPPSSGRETVPSTGKGSRKSSGNAGSVFLQWAQENHDREQAPRQKPVHKTTTQRRRQMKSNDDPDDRGAKRKVPPAPTTRER